MSAHHRPIHVMLRPIQLASGIPLLLQGRQDAVPHARFDPAVEAGGHRLPRSVLAREVSLGGSRAVNPQDAAQDVAVILGRASRTWLLRRQEWLQPLPLLVCQFISAHASSLHQVIPALRTRPSGGEEAKMLDAQVLAAGMAALESQRHLRGASVRSTCAA